MAFRFSHWLPRTVGYDALLIAERRALHAQTAAALEQRTIGSRVDLEAIRRALVEETDLPQDLRDASAELARHWESSGDAARCATFELLASDEALRQRRYALAAILAGEAGRAFDALSEKLAAGFARVLESTALDRVGQFERALAVLAEAEKTLPPGADAALVHGRLVGRRGFVLIRLGRTADAIVELTNALGAAEALGASRLAATLLSNLGTAHYERGEFAEATGCHQRALAVRTSLADRAGQAASSANMGIVAWSLGEYDRARALHEKAYALYSETGDRAGEASCLNNLGNVDILTGRVESAAERYEASHALFRGLGDRYREATTLNNLAGIHHSHARFDESEAMHREAMRLRIEMGDADGEAQCLLNIATLRLDAGRDADALALLDRAIETYERTSHQAVLAEALGNRAIARRRLGDPRAAEDAARAESLAERTGAMTARLTAGIAAALCFGDPHRAEAAVAKAAVLSDTDFESRALLALAEVRHFRGDSSGFAAAVAALEALAARADRGAMRHLLGRLRERVGVPSPPEKGLPFPPGRADE